MIGGFESWIVGLMAVLVASPMAQAQSVDVNDMPDAAFVKRFRPPLVDRMRFEPLPPDQRMLNEPKVKLLAR